MTSVSVCPQRKKLVLCRENERCFQIVEEVEMLLVSLLMGLLSGQEIRQCNKQKDVFCQIKRKGGKYVNSREEYDEANKLAAK